MNTTKVILIIGLIYVSLSYKDTSTRNMMLIMTGLIMICMLDLKEGLGCCPPGQFMTNNASVSGGLQCQQFTYGGQEQCVNCLEQTGCAQSMTAIGDCILRDDDDGF